MAISTSLERLGYDSPDGCIATGQHREVISGLGATRTLTAKESGALVVFDRAAGIVVTLPAPVVGMQFDFVVATTITSNAAKVITDAATTFLVGGVAAASSGATVDAFSTDGATDVAISSNGTTTGGVAGQVLNFTCISSTQWAVSGIVSGSGLLATPFAAS